MKSSITTTASIKILPQHLIKYYHKNHLFPGTRLNSPEYLGWVPTNSKISGTQEAKIT